MSRALETGALGQLESSHSNEFFLVAGFCVKNYSFRGNWQELPFYVRLPAITENYSIFSELTKICFLQLAHTYKYFQGGNPNLFRR